MTTMSTSERNAERVQSYETEQVRADQWPVVLLHYVGSRGTRKTSECRFNSRAAAERHARRLVGMPMR